MEQDRTGGSPLRDQLEGFHRVLIHDLSEEQFADMYAQTIAYGLFAARVNAPAGEHFSRQHAAYDLPKTNPFLRQMFGHIAGPDLDERITWAVDDLAELLARARMDLILADFGKRTRQEDPVVHFYETFLKAYDPKMREARGVYYTPEPVVSYIVRSVDHILKTEFGLADGLADNSMIEVPTADSKGTRRVHKVQILDPACGTGTFLAQVIETIHDAVVAKHGAGMWPGYVHDHLLPRLHGFELLMAPYAIAHLKLGLRLKETGYDIEQSERLRVYLTNSLEEAHEREHGQLTFFGNWLAEEADRASEVKRELPIMVILGNPPYSVSSQNKGGWITGLLEDYKRDLNERKLNLDDDFIKFLRFAQWRIDETGHGVLAFITNNSYFDGITHRRMRQSLLASFGTLRLLNLHGSVMRRERCADGTEDTNVFDIRQGVGVALMSKSGTGASGPSVLYASLQGSRSFKYGWLADHDTSSTPWDDLHPEPTHYFFVAKDFSHGEEYLSLPSVSRDVFRQSNAGVQTKRDRFVYGFTEAEVRSVLSDIGTLSADELRTRYGLPPDGRDWTIAWAKQDVALQDGRIVPVAYHPFDRRFAWYTGRTKGLIAYPRHPLMASALRPNLLLLTVRNARRGNVDSFFVANTVVDKDAVSPFDNAVFFPAFVYLREHAADLGSAGQQPERQHNLQAAFVELLSSRLGLDFQTAADLDSTIHWTPDDAVHYMYAIFYSPRYRDRYGEFLRIDHPRIPITSRRSLFHELCEFGARLVSLHLMEAEAAPLTTYPVPGENRVEQVRYTEPSQRDGQGRVWINTTQYFEGVPHEVWEFRVGGYQVCDKWLKDRKGRLLTYDDLTHYQRIVAALAETITLMGRIDEVIETHGGWPLS